MGSSVTRMQGEEEKCARRTIYKRCVPDWYKLGLSVSERESRDEKKKGLLRNIPEHLQTQLFLFQPSWVVYSSMMQQKSLRLQGMGGRQKVHEKTW